jgi:MFS family permease
MSAKDRVPVRHVIAVFIGNGLEFYDFLTFSYFAVYISRTFYPQGAGAAALLATLATFGAGFITRPIGAVILGRMGDRVGRKPAMLITFTLMGLAIAGLALTPSFATIGYAAPALVLIFRLVQGFALGGEVGPTTAYMAESAPARRRGLYLSMQFATQDAATLTAGIVAVTLAHFLSDLELQNWGWRAAMLLGASIVPFGLVLRRALPETLPAAGEAARAQGAARGALTLRRQLRLHLRIAVLGLVMLMAGTIGAYTIGYMTTYALDTLKFPAVIAFGVPIINGGFSMTFEALSGWIADRIGRKPVMIAAQALLVLSIFPCYWAIEHFRSPAALYGAETVMVILAALASVPPIVAITEQLPASIRSGALATIYALAISIFGGTTQFVAKGLITLSGDALAPAYYWTAAGVLGLIAMLLVKESAPARTGAA